MLFARPKGQPFGCPFCSTTVACGLFSLSLSRRAKKLPPEVFLYALSNPFGCNFVPIKRRDSIRASAGAWSLAVTTLHRSVALCRSSFESLPMKKPTGLSSTDLPVLARPKGFEPPIFRIGICCVIQLRHGRKYFICGNKYTLKQIKCQGRQGVHITHPAPIFYLIFSITSPDVGFVLSINS